MRLVLLCPDEADRNYVLAFGLNCYMSVQQCAIVTLPLDGLIVMRGERW